ncbi:MAG: type II toxin-antitoxin system prevent-host-death family antitoxin [Caldilineaceae bacterium]
MLTISKSKLKAQMLQIFRQIEQTGEEVIVTDKSRPVLRIQPIAKKRSLKEMFGEYDGQVIYYEEINTPMTEEWEALT